jgi:cytochrome c-type biogenesis protein CcmH/NrfF
LSGRAGSFVSALAAIVIGCAVASGCAAQAAERPAPRVEISDVEAEVMCPICGTLLELSDSPQARREKAFIAEMIAAGRSRSEIKDALVAEYGAEVLALPEGSGFNLSAYLVPAIAFLVAAFALAIGVRRWRGRGSDGGGPAAGPEPPAAEDSERLDADIARYDL